MDKNALYLPMALKGMVDCLTKEQAGTLLQALYEFAATGNVPALDDVATTLALKAFLGNIADKLKEERERHELFVQAGKNGAIKKAQMKKQASQAPLRVANEASEAKNDNNNFINKEISIKDNIKNISRFKPPTKEQVAAYCRERKNSIDSEKFCDYYEMRGWQVSGKPMKSWQAAIRLWEKNAQAFSSGKKTINVNNQRELYGTDPRFD